MQVDHFQNEMPLLLIVARMFVPLVDWNPLSEIDELTLFSTWCWRNRVPSSLYTDTVSPGSVIPLSEVEEMLPAAAK